jgi:signal transduction histidine kinase
MSSLGYIMNRVLLLLGHPGNRRLLRDWLGRHYEVVRPDVHGELDTTFDLAVLDAVTLAAKRDALHAMKQAAGPVFLPYLLLAPRDQANVVGRYLGQTVDELLWTPVDPAELQTRIKMLLRLREQSLALKQHNDELEALLEARRAVELMKDEFISIASHELRSPLAAIKMYVNMVLDGEVGKLNEQQGQFLQIAEDNTERLSQLVNDLLDVSRMTSGRLQCQIREIDLGKEVPQACASLRILGDHKQIQTEVIVPPEPVMVQADPRRVEQILTNLLSNAYKYSLQETTVKVRVSNRGEVAQVDISDQGIGIAEADQARLFDIFFRAEAVRNSHISGTGLGLYITRKLVELQAGDIWVESELNKGSTFSWTLPIAPAEGQTSDQRILT